MKSNNPAKQREKTIILTSAAGIGGNVLLVAFKALVGFLTGSISIISDALNNLSDALSSLITIIGTKLSGKRPDKKHPYGHGRIEYLTSSIIGVLILFAGALALYESIVDAVAYYRGGELSVFDNLAFIIIAVAIAVKVGLGLLFRVMGKRVASDALKASGTDALFDALLSLGTLVGALVTRFASFYIEGYIGAIIGIFIIRSGVGVLRESVSSIIGDRAEEGLSTKIKQICLAHKEVKGVYDVILNNYGPTKTIGSLHIEVDDEMEAKEIHGLCRIIESEIYLACGVVSTIGIYASNDSSPEAKLIKTKLREVLNGYPTLLQMHGFYVDNVRKIVTYDLIFDFAEEHMEENASKICAEMKDAFPEYSFYPILDQDYSD
ncbi:MAG: cation diffusion facilitator family transporter [Bacilli bacterium]|nr:cation diffusion facilitator family transporter [Bacilli bacterium]